MDIARTNSRMPVAVRIPPSFPDIGRRDVARELTGTMIFAEPLVVSMLTWTLYAPRAISQSCAW
jgi:hypothetical protein